MALDILNAKKVADNGLLSKIQIGGKTYEVKDLIARENIQGLAAIIDALKYVANTGIYADDAAIKAAIEAGDQSMKNYVDAQVGAINKFDVKVLGADEALPTASEETMFVLYLKPDANAEADAYIEYITVKSGDEYKWEAIGSTKMDLSDYITETELAAELKPINDRLAELGDLANKDEADLDLKALAHKDSATGTVAGQTITGVKATGTSTGSITVELEQTEHAMNSTGKFKPAGTISGTAKTAGSISVTAKHEDANAVLTKGDYTPAGTVSADFTHASAAASIERGDYTPAGTVSANFGHSATAATLTKGDYTPAGDVSVTLTGASFNAITSVGTAASFQEGAFTPASLSYDAVEKNVAKEGLVGKVEDECLTFTAAGLEAISASKVTAFNGGSKAADQFTANSLPTMVEQNVGVQSATFSGTKAEGALVTGVSYKKADIDAATFTGAEIDINATFAGTEGDIAVAGLCHDYAVKTAKFNGAAIELAVGDIAVAAKEVTVQ